MTRLGISQDYNVTNAPTVLEGFSGASVLTDWPSSLSASAVDTSLFKEGTQSLKISGTVSGTRLHYQSISPAWDMSAGGVIKIRFFAVNLPSNGQVQIRLSRATSVAGNNIAKSFNRNFIQDGWNELVIHTNEDGTTHGSGTGWTAVGATVDFSVAMQACAIDVDAATNDSTEIYFDSIEYAPRSRPKIMIGFDSNAASLETNALPYMTAANMKAYVACEGMIGTGGFATGTQRARLQTFYAAGWDIIGHTVTHPDMTTLSTYQDFLDEMEPNFAEIQRLGLTRGIEHFAYPLGITDGQVVAWMEQYGKLTARTYGNYHTSMSQYGLLNPHWFGSRDMNNTLTLANAKLIVDAGIKYGTTVSLFGHEIDTVADSLTWATADFEALIDYIEEKVNMGFYEVVTPSEWFNGFTKHRRLGS